MIGAQPNIRHQTKLWDDDDMTSDYHRTLTAAGNLAESRPLPDVINAPLKYRRKTGVRPAVAAGNSEIDESFEWKTVAIADGTNRA